MIGPVARPRPSVAVDRRLPTPIEAIAVGHRDGHVRVLEDVTLRLRTGEVNALLGAPGAGKTTLLRILGGLISPTEGEVLAGGAAPGARALRAATGLVPSAARSFYPRLSASENLVFFARLRGLRRGAARVRADEVLEQVGLASVAARQVRRYTAGMEKRLSFARALLGRPQGLLVDEATRSLDGDAAQDVRELATSCARAGAAVLWATTRSDELPGFCDRVTVLQDGRVRFDGDLTTLAAYARGCRYILRVGRFPPPDRELLDAALGGIAALAGPDDGDPSHMLLTLRPGASLGAAISVLVAAGVNLIACREERPAIDASFLALIGDAP
jgi:ABC-type multidrug transport system ATPase subunit